MDETKKFTKLSVLVGDQFTVENVGEYVFKKWNPAESKMEVSNDWQEGYRKLYPVTTDKGQLDMGSGQLGSLLEAVFHSGKADLIGKTFNVKSNGKMGMDIRYFFNVVKTPQKSAQSQPDEVIEDIPDEPINLNEIPF